MHVPVSDKARELNLQPGEWQLFCSVCDFKAEKNTAMNSRCPECGKQLHIASEPDSASRVSFP